MPDFVLLTTNADEIDLFARCSETASLRVITSVGALESLDPNTVLVIGPTFGTIDGISLLPLVSHHPTIAICDDSRISEAFDAGATDVVHPAATLADLERAACLAPQRHERLTRMKTRVDDLRAALAALPVGMVVIESGTIVYQNAAVTEMLDGKAYLGETVESIFHGDDLVIWDASARPAELRLRANTDGDSRTVQVSELSTLHTRDGTLSLVTLQDVTSERTLTTQLHQAERSSSLQSIALEIAHEVNNPLAIFAQDLPELASLVEDNWNPAQREIVDEILEELTMATNRISGAVTTLRAAAHTVKATSDLGAVMDAARASSHMRGANQFSFGTMGANIHRTQLALDPATATPMLSATFSLAAAYANKVDVSVGLQGETAEIYCDLIGSESAALIRKVVGNVSPAQLAMKDCEWASALSVELSIARRAGVQLLCIDRDGDVRLTIRLPVAPRPKADGSVTQVSKRDEQSELAQMIDAFAGLNLATDSDATQQPKRTSSTVVQVPTLAH